MNFLASRLLEEIQIKPGGFLALNDKLRIEIGVFSIFVRNSAGNLQFSTPEEYQQLAKNYALLRYDWLDGEQFQKR